MEKKVFDQPVRNDIKTYENIPKHNLLFVRLKLFHKKI